MLGFVIAISRMLDMKESPDLLALREMSAIELVLLKQESRVPGLTAR
jgi:hypothetical protein